MKYKYILFDLDGTLTDPRVGITKSVQYALEKTGIKEVALRELERFIGPPLKESFMEFYSYDEQTVITAIKYYREYFQEQGIFENEVYQGIADLLDQLTEQGTINVVATSKPTVFAERIIEYFGLKKYFHSIVGSNLDGTRSSKAEIISYIIAKLNINTMEDMVMIGDRKHDVVGAQRNNIDSIGVSYGYGTIEELRSVNPTFIVDSISELSKLLVQ